MNSLYGYLEELVPHSGALAVDLLGCSAEAAKDSLGHRQRHLALPREDLLGPCGAQRRNVAQIHTPHERVDPRVQFTCNLGDLRRTGVSTTDDHRSGVAQPGSN